LGTLGIEERIILNWILAKYCVRMWTTFDSGQGTMTVNCEHGNENSGSIQGNEFLE
jgi:hypothetical protein